MASTEPHAAPATVPARPRAPRARLVLLALAGISVLSGLDAALVRLGALAPVASAELGSVHGLLMVYGFLGTAICLERAVALQTGWDRPRRWAYLAPLSSGLAALAALVLSVSTTARTAVSGLPIPAFLTAHLTGFAPARMLPGLLWILAMAVLVGIYVEVHRRRQASYAVLVQLLGAVIGLGGALAWWRGVETSTVVPWLLMFLVVTIVGERLELARMSFLGGSTEPRVLAESLAVLVALVGTLLAPRVGYPLLGLALGALALDTAWHDVARRTIRLPGLPRLAATCMLSGYAWCAVPALLWIAAPPASSGYGYDAAVHALTLGFVVSMLLAHAPVIIPAVAKRDVPFHPMMWLAWALLESSLLVRLLAGARGAEPAWRFGGSLGVVAVLVFIGTTLVLAVSSGRPAKTHTVSASDPADTEEDPRNSADSDSADSETVCVSARERR